MTDRVLVEESPLFAGLDRDTRCALAGAAVIRRAGAGTTLFRAGAPPRGLILVLAGTVRVVGQRQGRQHLVHEGGPGETLGEVPLFAGGGYPATGIASSPCVYAVFGAEPLRAVMQRDPGLAWLLLARLAHRVRHLVSRLERNTAWPVRSRLAEIVLARQASAGTAPFTLGATQAALAEELGTVREVVVRILGEFRQAGLLSGTGRGRYLVTDAEGLRALVM